VHGPSTSGGCAADKRSQSDTRICTGKGVGIPVTSLLYRATRRTTSIDRWSSVPTARDAPSEENPSTHSTEAWDLLKGSDNCKSLRVPQIYTDASESTGGEERKGRVKAQTLYLCRVCRQCCNSFNGYWSLLFVAAPEYEESSR